MAIKELLHSAYRYAFSLTHNEHDAEDLVQEAWFKLNLKTRLVTPHKSLLFATIRNQFIDQYRRNNLVVLESLDTESVLHLEYDESAIDQLMDQQLVEQSLLLLRVEEREVIFLSCVEGYTAKEIALLIDKTRNTVLSLLYRAKQKMRQHMINQLETNELEENAEF